MDPRRRGQQGGAKVAVLASACLLLGAAGGAYWFHQAKIPETPTPADTHALRQLSEVTRTILRRLESPLELRFYSILDPASVSESDRAFAARVDSLLEAYQREGDGKIKLTRQDNNSAAEAAAADGIKPFNLDKGNACFLGLTLALEARKETLAQLSIDWEPALETDVTRAISRLLDSQPRARAAATPAAKSDAAVFEEVKRVVPNYESLPFEEASGVLRDATLKQLKAAVEQGDAQTKQAREQFAQAQNAGSAAEMEAARQRLRQLQAEQMDAIKRISARSQAQMEALRQLKKEVSK